MAKNDNISDFDDGYGESNDLDDLEGLDELDDIGSLDGIDESDILDVDSKEDEIPLEGTVIEEDKDLQEITDSFDPDKDIMEKENNNEENSDLEDNGDEEDEEEDDSENKENKSSNKIAFIVMGIAFIGFLAFSYYWFMIKPNGSQKPVAITQQIQSQDKQEKKQGGIITENENKFQEIADKDQSGLKTAVKTVKVIPVNKVEAVDLAADSEEKVSEIKSLSDFEKKSPALSMLKEPAKKEIVKDSTVSSEKSEEKGIGNISTDQLSLIIRSAMQAELGNIKREIKKDLNKALKKERDFMISETDKIRKEITASETRTRNALKAMKAVDEDLYNKISKKNNYKELNSRILDLQRKMKEYYKPLAEEALVRRGIQEPKAGDGRIISCNWTIEQIGRKAMVTHPKKGSISVTEGMEIDELGIVTKVDSANERIETSTHIVLFEPQCYK